MPRRHWPEYAIEAALLAGFMVSATAFTVLLESPGSPIHAAMPWPLARRGVMGLAMALTAIVLTYSPWGGRTGAHLNPAVSVMFTRLGRMRVADAAGYITAHFAGGIAGVALARLAFGPVVAHRSVNWVATVPGPCGALCALAAEAAMTATLFGIVLRVSSHPRWQSVTGIAAACCVAVFITVEAPLSGMSLNPARTFGPAMWSGEAAGLWIYFVAPLAGMGLATEVFRRVCGSGGGCPTLHHGPSCLFCAERKIA
jgi:aquaporin Z